MSWLNIEGKDVLPTKRHRFQWQPVQLPVVDLLKRTANRCILFSADSTITTDHSIDYYAISFPETTFEFDSIKKFTKSQAVFLEATLVLLVSWLRFCLFLRLMKPGNDGRSIWFRLKWWVSTLDIYFATEHWLVSYPFHLSFSF
ncbi:hypothetical protein TorRG33x02_043400 [Trema orientale]|uniref:Uncharacterized protein n=1 Tax=Trema orientale TaxID=63057 RepID=A0A2P5FQ45_TREOI|nr:hypothetical protein TorRG33x02_043400 [Trema orientale]